MKIFDTIYIINFLVPFKDKIIRIIFMQNLKVVMHRIDNKNFPKTFLRNLLFSEMKENIIS